MVVASLLAMAIYIAFVAGKEGLDRRKRPKIESLSPVTVKGVSVTLVLLAWEVR